jgi:hypothetical protein
VLRNDEPAGGDPWTVAEYDTPAEVDATFRTQRRIAIGYFLMFLVGVLAIPLLTALLDWWSIGRLVGEMSPGFAMVAVGLYAFFFALGLGAATLTNAVEDRMLGGSSWQGVTGEAHLANDDEEAPGA